MAPMHKVAVIQLDAEPLQIEANFSKATSYIRSAAAEGASLAVLPEYHLTSWVPDTDGFLELCDLWEIYLRKYQALARELRICIAPGTIVKRVRDTAGGDWKLFNVAYFLDENGNILGEYTKKNLWHAEREHLTSSGKTDKHQAFDTPLGRVGFLICWDLAFPEGFRELVMQGAKLIIIPSFWALTDNSEQGLLYNPSSEAVFLDSTLTARAFENTCAIIFANIGGPLGSGKAGLSQVSVPFIGPIARLGSSAEGMIVVDVDFGIVDIAEQTYKIRADLAREDWHYGYSHRDNSEEKADSIVD